MVSQSLLRSSSLRGQSRRSSGASCSPKTFRFSFLETERGMRPWRGYRRPFQSVLIPCLLVFLAFVVSAASADIFLAADVAGGNVWDGDCSTTECTSPSPCEPNFNILTSISSGGGGPCIITFKAQAYWNSPIIWDLPIGATIMLSDGVSDLNQFVTHFPCRGPE